MQHRLWSVVTGAEIDLNAKIGGGLLRPHPNGIVIHPDAVIVCNCLIFQQVTLGTSTGGVFPRSEGMSMLGRGLKFWEM